MKWFQWRKGAGRGLDAVDGASGPGAAAGLLDREAFARDLQRHRALCDRAGGQFILMIFEISSGGSARSQRATLEKLAGVISRRVRVSDVAGDFYEDSRRIGVILPHTDSAGADRFLKAVDDLMRRSMNGSWTSEFRLVCETFTYPEGLVALAMAEKEPGIERAAAKTN
jgi:hypothetical protein